MTYVNDQGLVSPSSSWWRLSSISDLFWGILNALYVFFYTLIPTAAERYKHTGYPDGPPRNRGGFGTSSGGYWGDDNGSGGGGSSRRRFGTLRDVKGSDTASMPMRGG
eukprot:TRINITY_DN18981_c0_g1_i1.p2 TRINITY_DN18981_c0_g1~~TRINITY_DN18981_c0_g1_i1.p2  ORF type:complete len:108 (-),score=17.04 TRINITY_DN18981_c0_g1_i1:288-611(-)